MNPYFLWLLIIKKSAKLKTFLIKEVFKKKFNIRSDKLTKIKTWSGKMLLNIIIFQKLSRILIFIILISYNFNQKIS